MKAAVHESLGGTRQFAPGRARELGQRALAEGLGAVDLARAHHAVLRDLLEPAASSDTRRRFDRAGEFLAETLSPLDLARKIEHDALRRADFAAEEANQELEALSLSMAHDLRTSLVGIQGLSKALLRHCSDGLDEEGKSYLHDMQQSVQQMAQLIDGLMALARVSGSEVRWERVDLSRLALHVGARLLGASARRQVEFQVEPDLRVHGDPRLIELAMENLLSNAWKFTAKRRTARIDVGRVLQPGGAAFFVRDNGAGFNMAYVDRLFGAFQRLHPASEFEGHGLGLATVRRIVRRHGGRVWAEGRVGVGATFFFTLGEGVPTREPSGAVASDRRETPGEEGVLAERSDCTEAVK